MLKGSAPTTISFFGACNFSTKQGFLIVTKQDNEMVFIDDLEVFTPGTWVEVEVKEWVSGAYSAFYHHCPQLEIISDRLTGAADGPTVCLRRAIDSRPGH